LMIEGKSVLVGRKLMALSAIMMVGMLCVSLVGMHTAFAVALGGCLLVRPSLHRLPGFWFGVAFAAWQMIGAIIITYHQGHDALWHRGHGAAFTWLAGYVFVAALADVGVRKWALRVGLVAVMASVILSVFQFIIGHGGARPWRVNSSGPRYSFSTGFMPLNLSQGFILAQMGLLFVLGKKDVQTSVWMRMSGWLISAGGVLIAGSRSGFLSLISAATAFFSSGKWSWWRLVGTISCAGVLTISVSWWMRAYTPGKLDTMLAGQDARWTIYHVASVMISERPCFGAGPNGGYSRESDIILPRLYPDGSQNGLMATPDAHNFILGLASEHGVPALIFFLLMLAAILRHLYRRREYNPYGWRIGCGAMAALLVGGQFENYAGHSATSYAFFTVLAMAMALDRAHMEELGLVSATLPDQSVPINSPIIPTT
jgi:O-Antigen ligase